MEKEITFDEVKEYFENLNNKRWVTSLFPCMKKIHVEEIFDRILLDMTDAVNGKNITITEEGKKKLCMDIVSVIYVLVDVTFKRKDNLLDVEKEFIKYSKCILSNSLSLYEMTEKEDYLNSLLQLIDCAIFNSFSETSLISGVQYILTKIYNNVSSSFNYFTNEKYLKEKKDR